MKSSKAKVSRVLEEGFTIQDMVEFINLVTAQGHSRDSKIRVRTMKAFHPDGGLIKIATVESVDVAE